MDPLCSWYMRKKTKTTNKPRSVISGRLVDGALVETIHLRRQKKTIFCVSQNGLWHTQEQLEIDEKESIPFSAKNNLIKHKVILLPDEPVDYGTEEELIKRIQAFIHKYVHVSPLFEQLSSYYVLLTWIYDCFHELPYLRLKGDPGCGKTRFLLTVGSLCYKPIFASGASTVSPLFRMLDTIRGTLIMDEGDFRYTDERSEIIKILNNGNARGFPVLRSEVTPWGEYNPHAFYVYGPKLVATRKSFDDPALETRCITEEMGVEKLRDDIPINLTDEHEEEATHLRNMLLMFRFKMFGKIELDEEIERLDVEPRLKQVLRPLFSVIKDPAIREELIQLMGEYEEGMATYRGMQIEAQVLEVISEIKKQGDLPLSIPEIASWFSDRYGDQYDNKVTVRTIGKIIRETLQLKPKKTGGTYVIPVSEYPKLEWLFEKYSVNGDL